MVGGTSGTNSNAYAPALAFGATGPNDVAGSLNNLLYAGTAAGRIFVTFTGGGSSTGNAWTEISNGLDGSVVARIITNPTRGSREAYAVTLRGVYYLPDSADPNATWQNITGNLFSIQQMAFNNPLLVQDRLSSLTTIQADWRYAIPEDPTISNSVTHPVLYVGGEGGVFRSFDNGLSWRSFPDQGINNSPADMGYLPTSRVSDLDLALGAIDPTTGRPIVSTGPNILVASTYGRGAFAIRLAPIVFPNSTDPTQPRLLRLAPISDNGPSNSDGITSILTPIIQGFSEQSAFGNTVTITLLDLTDPNNPIEIPVVAGTATTDALGNFRVQVASGYFTLDKLTHVIGVQAVNGSGTKGNIATLSVTLRDTTIPPAPAVPTLDPRDNSGSKADNITNVRRPRLVGAIVPEVGEPPARILITNANGNIQNPLGVALTNPDGSYVVQFTNPDHARWQLQLPAGHDR